MKKKCYFSSAAAGISTYWDVTLNIVFLQKQISTSSNFPEISPIISLFQIGQREENYHYS